MMKMQYKQERSSIAFAFGRNKKLSYRLETGRQQRISL